MLPKALFNTGMEEGFCYYNNVAIAARYAQEVLGFGRVLIVDWDYHHGNGTQDAFYSDPSVLFFSTHNAFAYPQTGDPLLSGEGAGKGYNINVHLECGSGDSQFLTALDERLMPAAGDFEPEFVLISAGFDSRRGDPLGCFDITDNGFAEATKRVMAIADTHAQGRIVSALEGGYNVEGVGMAATAHIAALCGLAGARHNPQRHRNYNESPGEIRDGKLYLAPRARGHISGVRVYDSAGRLVRRLSEHRFDLPVVDLFPGGTGAGAYQVVICTKQGDETVLPCFVAY
jgi:acetoin utilization deacetylase AcuC-like enzyme